MGRIRIVAQIAFFALIVRPLLFLLIGLRAVEKERLPLVGPAVVAANHNSHLDIVALMSLFPLGLLHRVRPVAAADVFSKPGPLGWIARNLLGIVPIDRSGQGAEVALAPVRTVLDRGEIVIIFPEGTRGAPETLKTFKRGASVLAAEYPDVPFVPVYLTGLGKSLPKGEWIIVPFVSEARIGVARTAATAAGEAMSDMLRGDIEALAAESKLASWAV